MVDDASATRFLQWLEGRVVSAGRGDRLDTSPTQPSGRFWLGRLASEPAIAENGLGARGERLEPCATGLRVRPRGVGPWTFEARVRASAWLKEEAGWRKVAIAPLSIVVSCGPTTSAIAGADVIAAALTRATGRAGLSAEVRVDPTVGSENRIELAVLVVNTSPKEHDAFEDTRLYEVGLEVTGLDTDSFVLTALPDSFRYDRRVPAYGVNGGVAEIPGGFALTDVVVADRARPEFWGSALPAPDLTFATLERDGAGCAAALADALRRWGDNAWSNDALDRRARRDDWSAEMQAQAAGAALEFAEELRRIDEGVRLLRENPMLRRSFALMNRAIGAAAAARGYDEWRPFQIGFILANLSCIASPEEEADVVDIVWFATGGGKTETYLGLLVTAAFFDRLRGKSTGITAWTRFPLRMLSLQQLQRFADAIAAAEVVRRAEGIPGDPFSMGFLVGQASTPNSLKLEPKPDEPDVDDEAMPRRYRMLQRCPFCRNEGLEMRFDRAKWRLDHCCDSADCPWPEAALPFHVVDDEIYRFLPTVVVGTLDKAASIGMQASMRGLVGPPMGRCTRPGHGFTYSPRSARPSGCLVPDCRAASGPLGMAEDLFGPSYRLQDELHLLRDSLGAVDAHYEALLDGLEMELCGRRAKVLASSATLEGYDRQVDVLYRRSGRVFPQQGPSVTEGFWTTSSDRLMRRYVAVAPRGLTLDFVNDRIMTELQRAVRDLIADPVRVCAEVGVDPALAEDLASLYGTDVVYGNTLRDLDAVERSVEGSQVEVEGPLNTAVLTGRTDFEDVRGILERLERPEPDFADRLHLVAASSMMSHGVDVDRLNVMVMVGLPLSTAEFIQATARVGRRHPGLVFVLHKIGRERDAGVFRSFPKFVEQGDRFVEPIPITRKSRRVLERTLAGLAMARILMIHEPRARRSLATIPQLRTYLDARGMDFETERAAVADYLGIDGDRDAGLSADLDAWFDRFERNLRNPLPEMRFPNQACPEGAPMRSLRDVEEQVPLFLDDRA